MATKNFIQKAIKHPGALTAQAKRAGKSLSQFEKSPGKNASATTKKRIAFAKLLSSVRPKGKKKK